MMFLACEEKLVDFRRSVVAPFLTSEYDAAEPLRRRSRVPLRDLVCAA